MGRGGKKPGIRKWLEWAALSANCSAIKNNPTQFLPQFRAHYQNCPDAIPENSISRNECVVRGWLEGGGGGDGAGGVDWMTRKWNGEITVVGSVATKWNYTRIEIMNDARIFHVYSGSKFVWNAIREDSPVLSYRKTEGPISKWKLPKVEKPVNERTRRAN